jgi:hypothetical protein
MQQVMQRLLHSEREKAGFNNELINEMYLVINGSSEDSELILN